MTASSWDALPLRTRNGIVDHVERSIATYRTQEIEDVARWAVEALLKDDVVVDSYNEGFEDGRQAQMAEAGAA